MSHTEGHLQDSPHLSTCGVCKKFSGAQSSHVNRQNRMWTLHTEVQARPSVVGMGVAGLHAQRLAT